jgi:hypothetical protein
MPWNPFAAIEADLPRLLPAFSDEEVVACREDFSLRMKWIVASGDDVDLNVSGEGTVRTDQEAIDCYGMVALVLRPWCKERTRSGASTSPDRISVRDEILGWSGN